MPEIVTRRAKETEGLGETWARDAVSGWVIGLQGDLGAGKTQFVKGFARGIGYGGKVHSPTFALVNEYRGGRLPIFHLDLYRLDSPELIVAAGLEEYLYAPTGVALVEWMERWLGPEPAAVPEKLPKRYRHARIETLSEQERKITYEDFGA